jgi:hypothetical protein
MLPRFPVSQYDTALALSQQIQTTYSVGAQRVLARYSAEFQEKLASFPL